MLSVVWGGGRRMKNDSTGKIFRALALGVVLILSGLVLPGQAVMGDSGIVPESNSGPGTIQNDLTNDTAGNQTPNPVLPEFNNLYPNLPSKAPRTDYLPNTTQPFPEPGLNETEPPVPPVFNITIPEPPKVYPIPDFTIRAMDNSELTILSGGAVHSNVTIENAGLLWYDEIPVAVYDGNVSPENLLDTKIATFDEYTANVSFELSDLGVGIHQITVVVDPSGEVVEQNENNNTARFDVLVTTTSTEPLSIIGLIKLLMAEVNASASKPYSKIINSELLKAIVNLKDASSKYASGKNEKAIGSINNALDNIYMAVSFAQQFYLSGKISLANYQSICSDAGAILSKIVDLGRLYLNNHLADDIAVVEKSIYKVLVGALIEIPNIHKWGPIEGDLVCSLIQFESAMKKVASCKDSSQEIQTGYDLLMQARNEIKEHSSQGDGQQGQQQGDNKGKCPPHDEIPLAFADWALDVISKALLVFAPDLAINNENINTNKLASIGKKTEISVIVRNIGRTVVHSTTLKVYDDTERVLLASKTVDQLNASSQTTVKINWKPSTSGTHTLRFIADPDDAVFEISEINNQAIKGFYVTSGTTYVGPVHIPSGKFVDWDLTNTTITGKTIVVSGDIIIDGTLNVSDDYTVVMNCTSDNQYMILVNPTGELNANGGHFTSPSKDLTFSFLVGGRLTLIGSTVQWMWGDTTGIIEYGGIQLFSSTIDIEGSEIFEGKTHGIYIDIGVTPSIISGNTIRNNGQAGILYRETSNGIIDYNNISSNTYGVYCYQASPTITNNQNISWNTNSGIYCDRASPSISSNTLRENKYGINFLYDSTSVVSNNQVFNNTENGIRCFGPVTSSPTIQDNPAISGNGCGVYAFRTSPQVDGNVLSKNSQAVVGQFSSSHVVGNTIYNNTWGINALACPMAFEVTGNSMLGNEYGIWLSGASPVISNNINISSNNKGIHCDFGSAPTIEQNRNITWNDIGIACYNGSAPTIRQCNITDSTLYGIYCNMSSPDIVNNSITRNGLQPGGDDGGILCIGGSNPRITMNNIYENYGAGILAYKGSAPTIDHNIILGNAGGVVAKSSSPTITYNMIWSNRLEVSLTGSEFTLSHNNLTDLVLIHVENETSEANALPGQTEVFLAHTNIFYILSVYVLNSTGWHELRGGPDWTQGSSGIIIFFQGLEGGSQVHVTYGYYKSVLKKAYTDIGISWEGYVVSSAIASQTEFALHHGYVDSVLLRLENAGGSRYLDEVGTGGYDDYTVNYTTGAITMTWGLQNADRIYASYPYLRKSVAQRYRADETVVASATQGQKAFSLDYGNLIYANLYILNSTGWHKLDEVGFGGNDDYTIDQKNGYGNITKVLSAGDQLFAYYSYMDPTIDLGKAASPVITSPQTVRLYVVVSDDSNGSIDHNNICVVHRSLWPWGTFTYGISSSKGRTNITNNSIFGTSLMGYDLAYGIAYSAPVNKPAPVIRDNRITIINIERGIYVFEKSPAIINNTIWGGAFWGGGQGIFSYAVGGEIINNTLYYNSDAIIGYRSPANISGNNVYSNDYGIVNLEGSMAVKIADNEITSNTYGIYLKGSAGTATNNNVSNNGVGIFDWNSTTSIMDNDMISNDYGVLCLPTSGTITDNSITQSNIDGIWGYSSDGMPGGIKVDTGTYKVVYLGFGFEAINSSVSRMDVMGRVIDWLEPTLVSNVLLVDDGMDFINNYSEYYTTALTDNGIGYDYWDTGVNGAPPTTILATYPVVIWFTGDYGWYPNDSVINVAEQTNLASFLDNGGRLFMSGQGIGWNLGSWNMFYEGYLHAWCERYISYNQALRGVASDATWGGLTTSIEYGEGANNQRQPEVILPMDSYATPILLYDQVILPAVSANEITANTESGIYLNHYRCNVSGNPIISGNKHGIHAYYSAAEIYNNDINGNSYTGVICQGGTASPVTANDISNNGWGILCYDQGNNSMISGNSIEDNQIGGIYLYDSKTIIQGNDRIFNNINGIYCHASSPYIRNNNISLNTNDAIYSYCSTPVIVNNSLYGNLNGIVVVGETSILSADEHVDGTGYALICCSANDYSGAPDQDSMPADALRAYNVLKNKGYTDDRIVLMLYHNLGSRGSDDYISIDGIGNDLYGPDHIQGTGDDPEIDVNNLDVTKDRLRAEMHNLAQKVTSSDNVLIYLTNHGTKNGYAGYCFEVGNEVVWEDEMNIWLQEIQSNCSKLYFIVDSCFSGNFIDSMAHPNRLCIAAADDCVGWSWTEATQYNQAGSFFGIPFWEYVDQDYSLQDAFEMACQYQPFAMWGDPLTLALIQKPQMQQGIERFGITGDVWITNNTVVDNRLCGVYCSYLGASVIVPESATIPDGLMGQGITPHVMISENTILENEYGIFGLETKLWLYNNTINHNYMGIDLGNCDENPDVIYNDLNYNEIGIVGDLSDNINVSNNTISNNNYVGILFNACSAGVVYNNTVTSNQWMGIELLQCSFNTILENNVTFNAKEGTWSCGIALTFSDNNTVQGNIASNNSGAYGTYGIRLWWSNHNTLADNTCDANGYSGIHLHGSTWNTISGDILTNNHDGGGLSLWGEPYITGCDHNIIQGNVLANNGVGIGIANSGNNTLRNNTISSNIQYGVALYTAFSNTIYHNNFIGNTLQAYDDGSSNIWNASYSSGGNYWSDYMGADLYSGPNQDVPGSDGIGDTPYTYIQGGTGAQDNYPLMNQIVWP
jgi:parallel beta-helix repeat protein